MSAGPRRSPDTAWQMIGDEAVVMNLAGSRVLGLNATGALVWSLLDEKDEEGLVEAVSEQFSIDADAAREDIRSFVDLLRERGLVVDG